MKRREFLVSAGVVAIATATPFATATPLLRRIAQPGPLTIQNAYSLWYNRPAAADLDGGFCFGYITSSGEVSVAEITDELLVRRSNVIFRYGSPSDHGSPALVKISKGNHKGKILACFCNHASPLMVTRTTHPGDIGSWEVPLELENGRSTYASLASLPSGRIILMHTIQERVGNSDAGEWRRTVARWTDDGGDSWSDPTLIVGFGAGTFPYSTPLSSYRDGRCAMAYAIYRSSTKRHHGLSLVVTGDSFKTYIEIPVDLGDESVLDTIPYETRWLENGEIAVSFSQVKMDGSAVSKIALIDPDNKAAISVVALPDVAVHTYAGGAAIDASGEFAISSPAGGGLIRHDIKSGVKSILVDKGNFSSPWIFNANGRPLLVALSNPKIRTTRDFSADLFIAQLR